MNAKRATIGFNLLYVRPGYLGGTVRYAFELLRWLQRSARYELIVFVQAGVIPQTDGELAQIARREFRVAGGLLGRVVVEHVVLPLVASRHRVDLLVSPGFVSPLWGRFAKVVTIHDLYYLLFPRFVRRWQRRYWTAMVPASLRAVDAAIAVSQTTRRDLEREFPWAQQKLHCVPLGADAIHPVPGRQPGAATYCLMVGNVTPNKDIETIFSALQRLGARGTQCRLIVAGGDPLGILSSARARFPDVDVRFIEHPQDAELAQFYAGALCLVQASRYEGFGLPVAEAMHLGCPVVASNVDVLREVAQDAALYFDGGSAEQLSMHIERLHRDESLRVGLIEAGWRNAQRYRWETCARETASVLDAQLTARAQRCEVMP